MKPQTKRRVNKSQLKYTEIVQRAAYIEVNIFIVYNNIKRVFQWFTKYSSITDKGTSKCNTFCTVLTPTNHTM